MSNNIYGKNIYSSIKDNNTFDILETRNININDQRNFQCESDEDYLECIICNSVAKNPQKCIECQRLMCSICISSWLQKSNECPNCKTHPYKKLNLSSLEQSLMNKVLIKCSLCDYGKFEYSNMIKHYELQHKMILYQCRMCNKKIELISNDMNDMSYHYVECMIKCVYCENEYDRNNIINHIEECDNRKICLECNDDYPLRFNNAHMEYYCRRLEIKK